ncbi:recombinase family protein [Streptomyces sp. NBC_00620]|uniref:recombinase family protein n=1 Tax=Streptomyces sp. NBC_00620 TaxID=2903666 RepID=UPI002252A4A8|nr:recombinase family protein [Streptomyces sp. NBC_00620]MCX4976263.1 recombinase family protein [Streptomyces sp. NBC_00620]
MPTLLAEVPVSFLNTAIYARLSEDRSGESENVRIQIAECQDYANDNRWPVVGTYSDNDIGASKFSKKPRPDYERLLMAVKSGRVNNILITEVPRLYRRLEELLSLIRMAETTALRRIQTTDGICYDLSTEEGVHAAINAVNNAMLEAARISKRVKRKQKKNAQQGKNHGGKRPYGYESDGKTLRECEAAIVRECAKRYISGETVSDIVRDLNARGVPSAQGLLWRTENLSRILLKKRYIGVREYNGVEYPAVWPAILTREQYDQMEARRTAAASRGTRKGKPARKYVLTGAAYCGRCGSKMTGAGRTAEKDRVAQRRYRCQAGDGHGGTIGCGKLYRAADPLELLVTEAVLHVFDDPRVAVTLAPPADETTVRALVTEFERRKAKQKSLVTDYANDLLTREEFALAKGIATAAVDEAREALSEYQDAQTLALIPADQTLREAWATAGLAWRSAVVGLVVERVIVHPATSGRGMWRGYKFNPEYIEIKWKV